MVCVRASHTASQMNLLKYCKKKLLPTEMHGIPDPSGVLLVTVLLASNDCRI